MENELENIKIKICFVSLNSYPLLKGINLGYVGGAEIQQVELAKELKKKGYDIHFITYAKEHNRTEMVNGINIVPVYNRDISKKLNYPKKMLLIWKKLKEVNADIYFYRAGSPGISSIFCKLNQKKIIKSIASDAEVTGESIHPKNWFIDYLLKIGNFLDIKLSNKVISQNDFQKSNIKSRYGIESIIIKNAFNIPTKNSIEDTHEYVLWVGTIRSVKQPHLFLKVAERFPHCKFLMIGGEGGSSELFKDIQNVSKKIKNLKFLGFVPHNKISDYYKKAIFLVNTSKTEGFPNVFLESWLHSVPVVSLNVDPDGIISKYELGYHSKTFEQMLDDIKRLLNDKELLKTIGDNGRKYVEEYHDITKIANQYETLIKNLTENHHGKFIIKI
jgi:glycosyltransferase involved in cell wall biosynthesis